MKITLSQISATFEAATALRAGKISRSDAVEISIRAGMYAASAGRYVESIRSILAGVAYKSTISSKALQYVLSEIRKIYSEEQFLAALDAVSTHLDYYAALSNGGPMNSSRAVIAKFRR